MPVPIRSTRRSRPPIAGCGSTRSASARSTAATSIPPAGPSSSATSRAAGSAGGFGGGGFGGGGGFPRGIDEDTLRAIAKQTGGDYYPADSAQSLEQVFAGLPTTVITKHEVVEVSFGFVGLGGFLAAFALLLGRAWRPLP